MWELEDINNNENNNDRYSKGDIDNNNISKSKGNKSSNKSVSSCEYEIKNKSSNESISFCESKIIIIIKEFIST